jgi:hypothetical protein
MIWLAGRDQGSEKAYSAKNKVSVKSRETI